MKALSKKSEAEFKTEIRKIDMAKQRATREAKASAGAWLQQMSKPVERNPLDTDDLDGDALIGEVLPPRPPVSRPLVNDWDTPSMKTLLEQPEVAAAWDDFQQGPQLRDLLSRVREDPAGQHGMHPALKELLMETAAGDLLKAAREELTVAKKKEKAKKKPKGAVPEYYVLLGVGVDATFEEIKKAYRKEALRWHPDKNRNSEEAKQRFQRIPEAFDTLFDPELRDRYDSGEGAVVGKAKKLMGHGWSNFEDDDEEVMTKEGLRYRIWSWSIYRNSGGRLDDDPKDLVLDSFDPRYKTHRKKLWWRMVGQ